MFIFLLLYLECHFDWFTAPWYLSEYYYSHMGLSDYKTHTFYCTMGLYLSTSIKDNETILLVKCTYSEFWENKD
jgi:hypothetical protein